MTAANRVSIYRGLLSLLGAAFQSGMIPTGVDGLGQRIGAGLLALAVTLAAGDKTADVVRAAPITAQGFVSVPGRDNNTLPNSQAAWVQVLIRVVIAALAALAG
jgi:hypothetical protein